MGQIKLRGGWHYSTVNWPKAERPPSAAKASWVKLRDRRIGVAVRLGRKLHLVYRIPRTEK